MRGRARTQGISETVVSVVASERRNVLLHGDRRNSPTRESITSLIITIDGLRRPL
jgi:hypothetical protein